MRRLFNALLNNRDRFLNAATGGQFEQRIMAFMLTEMRYNRLDKHDIAAELRAQAKVESDAQPIANATGLENVFVYQPNGSQSYPDLLVLIRREVVCIEIKFARNQKPVWNSGLPRPNGFYILGRHGRRRDITFFRGGDVLSAEDGRRMHDFFADLRTRQHQFNQTNATRQSHGFSVYIRKAFDQNKKYNPDADIDYYQSPRRDELQNNVLAYFAEPENSPS